MQVHAEVHAQERPKEAPTSHLCWPWVSGRQEVKAEVEFSAMWLSIESTPSSFQSSLVKAGRFIDWNHLRKSHLITSWPFIDTSVAARDTDYRLSNCFKEVHKQLTSNNIKNFNSNKL